MELKERFEEASETLPIQTCLDGKLEILYHGFKFIREKDGTHDILDLRKGSHQISVFNDDKVLDLFMRKPFKYVCNIYFAVSSSKKLLDMELNGNNDKIKDVDVKIKNLRDRVRRCISTL